MAKRTKKQAKLGLKLEALEQRQLLAGVTGAGTEVTPGGTGVQGDVSHFIQITPTGNKYDQVLLTGGSVSITNDPGQITRVSFLDLQGDIVQAEFSGAGTFTLSMADGYTTGVAPSKYNQTGVTYVQGLANISISGSDATSNVNVFSVGSGTAVNAALFDATHTGGDHSADIARISVVANPANPNGSTFGAIFAGNVKFGADSGVVGISAAGVQVQDVVRVGDIDATGTAIPTLTFGANSQFGGVYVQGGDLAQTNGKAINNTGSYGYTLSFIAGTDSASTSLPAQTPSASVSFTGANAITAAVKTFNLTTGVDTVVGSAGNDTVNGQLGAGATLTGLDNIDGAAGTDTINLTDLTGGVVIPTGITVKNVEVLNIASSLTVGASSVAPLDVSGITDLTTLNVTASTGADFIKAGSGQAVTVIDTGGKVTVVGGSTQNVTTTGGVALSGAAGAITVKDNGLGTGTSTIDGGTTVNLTNLADVAAADSGTITIGGTKAASGAVTVSNALSGVDPAYTANRAGGAIAITGGSTVTVTQTATPTLNPDTTVNAGANKTLTQSGVTVTGNASTTGVTVNQTASLSAQTTATAVSGVAEVTSIQFGTLKAGDVITIGSLTLTPTTDMTGKQVAAAFANLSSSVISNYNTGAVSGTGSDTVVFTRSSSGAVADLTGAGILTNTSTASTVPTVIVTTQGVSSVDSAGRVGIANGAVTVSDTNNTITSVSLSNYGTTGITSKALNSLTLTNSAGSNGSVSGAVSITNAAGATSLDLTVNGGSKGLGGITDVNNTYTTLKVHTTGSDTTLASFTDTSLTALTVDGTKVLTLTTAPASLTTVAVSGSAGLSTTLGNTVTSVDASGTSGAMTLSINPAFTSYAGGSGNDALTVTALPTKTLTGGAGTDTLVIDATAATFANPSSVSLISGFETLGLGASASGTYDATGFANLSIGKGIAAASGFSNVAAGTGLTITTSPGQVVTYALKDSGGLSDALTITQTASTTSSLVTTGIEAVTLNMTGTSGSGNVTLNDVDLTSLTVTGGRALSLTTTGATALATVNASAMTGALTHTTTATVSATVTSGSAADVLTAGGTTAAVTLNGGGGNDTLTANAGLDILTGGAGNDTFIVQSSGANVNTYTTITDASAGDVIRLAAGGGSGIESYGATKVTLGDTAVFQDYANAVVAAGGAAGANGYIGWFQFNGNTYIVESKHNGATTPSFVNTTDLVVKLNGLIDLSGAAVVENGGAPEIVIR